MSDMNWPVVENWKCETCKHKHSTEPALVLWPALTWLFAHGHCRCDLCHTQYNMRLNGNRVTTPISRLKEEYRLPAHLGWQKFGTPISQWTDEMWDEAFALAESSSD